MRTHLGTALVAAASILAGCGGANSVPATPAAPSGGQPLSPAMSGKAVFVVKIPAKKTASRSAKYLTADVQGIEFIVSQKTQVSAGYAFYAISSTASYCSSASSGLTCTLAVQALPGTDTITVNTYDEPNNFTANVISTGSVTATIAANTANTVNIVTSGIPTWFGLAVDNPYPSTSAGSSTQALHVLALDADGNVIVGPYDVPITFQNGNTAVAALSATSAAGSADLSALTIGYAGGTPAATTITVQTNSPLGASYNGGQPASLRYYPGAPGVLSSPSYLTFANTAAAPQTLTLSATGGAAAPFTASTATDAFGDWGISFTGTWAPNWVSGCAGIVSVSGSSPTFTISPVHGGVCYLNIGDTSGHSGAVPVVVQSM